MAIEPDVELTREETQNMPRTVRILSKDENIATTLYYIAPPETVILPETYERPENFKFLDQYCQFAHWPPLREVGVPIGHLKCVFGFLIMV